MVTEATITAGQSRQGMDYLRKDQYFEAFEDHYNDKIVVVNLLGTKRGKLYGRRALTAITDSYTQSMGHALFEDSDMPEPTIGSGFNPVFMTRYNFGRLRWTWAVEAMARAGKEGVWKMPRAEDMRQGRIQFEMNGARMMYLGPTQIMATVSARTDSNTFSLYGRNTRSEAANYRYKFGKHYLRKKQPLVGIVADGGDVDALGPIDGVNVNQRTVSSFDISNPDVPVVDFSGNLDNGATIGDLSIFVPWGSRRNADNNDDAAFDSDLAGPNGLLNLVVDATYKQFVYETDRASYPTLSAHVFHGTTAGDLRPFGEAHIELADDIVTEDENGGEDANTLLCQSSMRREYLKEVKGLRMFGEVLGKRGYGPNLVFSAGDTPLKIVTDRDCPPGLMWLLDTTSFGWYSESDFTEVDKGERFVANKASHEIVVVRSGNEVCRRPRNNALIGDFIGSVSGLTPA